MSVQAETYRGNILSGAVLGGYEDIVQLAFERGADIAAENHDATRRAAEYGRSEILDLLLERGGSVQAAHEGFAFRFATHGDIEGFRDILQKQPEILETLGGRLMARAANSNNKEFIEMLLGEGLTSGEHLGGAVIFAAQDGHEDILELLLNQSADFQGLDYDPLNEALFLATQNNHVKSVKLLLAHGADPRVKTRYAHAAPIDMTYGKSQIAKIFEQYVKQNAVTPAPSLP
jgi:ankyrin repeat protein